MSSLCDHWLNTRSRKLSDQDHFFDLKASHYSFPFFNASTAVVRAEGVEYTRVPGGLTDGHPTWSPTDINRILPASHS